jgi:hypothetical protein
MLKGLFITVVLLLAACSSDGGGDGQANAAGSGNGGNDTCPDVSGTWTVKTHCDASLVGLELVVTEKSCALTFAAPFDEFMGNVSAAGKITLSGPQTCSGDASPTAIAMVCTPGTCNVTLAR